MSGTRRSLRVRERRRVNYRALALGRPEPGEEQCGAKQTTTASTWPKEKLWKVRVIDEKVSDDKKIVKVHYINWPSKYDEWIEASDIVEKTAEIETEDAFSLFVHTIKVRIKEELHCRRQSDQNIQIIVPVQKSTFDKFKKHGVVSSKSHTRTVFKIENEASLDPILGKLWNRRIVNKHQDFAFVHIPTLRFWLREKRPLYEYNMYGKKQTVHRGYACVLTFVKGVGNKYALQ